MIKTIILFHNFIKKRKKCPFFSITLYNVTYEAKSVREVGIQRSDSLITMI